MNLISRILSSMHEVIRTQGKFLMSMFAAHSCFQGKANRENLSRFGAPSPRTQYRQQRKEFDFTSFNLKAIKDQERLEGANLAVMDASFLPKSGTQTYGRASFWNGSRSRAEQGLELSLIGLVDPKRNTAYALNAEQTPAEIKKGSRNDHYLAQLRKIRPKFPSSVEYILLDGAYAKHDFIKGVCDMKLHAISKLRKDAALKYLYTGPKKTSSGRKKIYDGKVRFNDLTRWEPLGEANESTDLYSIIAYHDSLKRKIRVVMLRKIDGYKVSHVLLFSTDTSLPGETIYKWYKARFQIEFIFRDAKQFTGLKDGQMRDEKSLNFHINMSLSTLNILRLQEQARGQTVISIASVKRRMYNECLINRIFSMLGLDPELEEMQVALEPLRNFGRLAS